MRKIMSIVTVMIAGVILYSCKNADTAGSSIPTPQEVEENMIKSAVKDKSTDYQEVKIVGNALVYTQITDGVVDIKTFIFEGDTCVEAERMFVYPDQMSALRHYRDAVEMAALYDKIEILGNQIKYDLKEAQFKTETAGQNIRQLEEKFKNEIADAAKDVKMRNEKLKSCCKSEACKSKCSK